VQSAVTAHEDARGSKQGEIAAAPRQRRRWVEPAKPPARREQARLAWREERMHSRPNGTSATGPTVNVELARGAHQR